MVNISWTWIVIVMSSSVTSSFPEQLSQAKALEAFLVSKKGESEKKQKEEKKQRFALLKKIGYFALLGFGLVKDIVGNFLFGYYLFSLIPLMPNPLLIVIGITFAAVKCIAFYAFEGAILRKALGIKDKSTDINQSILEQLDFLRTVKHINELLSDCRIADTTAKQYAQYKDMAVALNNMVRERKLAFNAYEESALKRSFRIGMHVFGLLTTVGSCYFLAATMLSIFAVSLAATPLAWLFVGLVMAAGISVYFLLKASSINALINPQQLFFKQLKRELKDFDLKEEADFAPLVNFQKEKIFSDTRELEPGHFTNLWQSFGLEEQATGLNTFVSTNPFD